MKSSILKISIVLENFFKLIKVKREAFTKNNSPYVEKVAPQQWGGS